MEKYFTPNIEDLRVGYECEIMKNDGPDKAWKPHIWYPSNFSDLEGEYISVRTPYLTRSQIEAEGWNLDFSRESTMGLWFYKKGQGFDGVFRTFEIKLFEDEHTIEIGYDCGEFRNCYIFEGKCPSINEFRMICKLLGI